MKSSACLCVPLLVMLAAPARAADASVDVAPSSEWSGPWAGVLGSVGGLDGDGAMAGVAAGYDAQFDHIVIGVDGDVSGGGIDARRLGGRFEIEALGTIRARVGYAFERFVLYGAAGVAFASAEYARNGRRDHETLFGWTVGGGLDVKVTGSVSARAEVLYVDLDRRSFDADGPAGFGPSGGIARLGLSYRF
ncbi:outer membrane beta-barrel protein [Methylopila sp. M107]|uniref:outer membrane protein n=1 Tax=Methylopila sp. M107 TaxID=1101190 RepID=UPI00037FC3FC|nr:outer membrane beta-barrel protein [Methylopila sp. M107]